LLDQGVAGNAIESVLAVAAASLEETVGAHSMCKVSE
jgi:hypothetical protein